MTTEEQCEALYQKLIKVIAAEPLTIACPALIEAFITALRALPMSHKEAMLYFESLLSRARSSMRYLNRNKKRVERRERMGLGITGDKSL